MSHFLVYVRVPDKDSGDLHETLENMLEPFNEQTKDKRYIEFIDKEEEYRKEYETDTNSFVKSPSGELLRPWDDRFKVPGALGYGTDTHKVPDDYERVEIPAKETYKTFDDYCVEYHGMKKDRKTGKYGYYDNPNGKWDWWTIGGRYSNRLTSNGKEFCDSLTISTLCMNYAQQEQDKRLKDFLTEWRDFLKGKEFDSFEGPRERAMELGLLDCKDDAELTGKEFKVIPWGGDRKRNDVIIDMTDKEIEEKYAIQFFPFSCLARLDSTGWQEPGKMGWFGCNSAEANDYIAFRQSQKDWLQRGDQSDILVCVDCHV